ncbi:MAG: ribosome-associated translation inhibitor RaiA, partial [Chloroflexi bacterium]|nr:ribosome-associated translation inhibitor RaiA [Chloroflexota bacterium]
NSPSNQLYSLGVTGMNIHIRGNNLDINDSLETYTRKKLARIDRYLPNIAEVWVELSKEHIKRGGDQAVAQITIRHQRGAILRAEERVGGDVTVAINQALDKLYRRIERFKGKRDRKGAERFSATLDELSSAETIPADEYVELEAEPEFQPDIIRRKQVTVTAMNEDEAIEQMELLGHTFFIFYNQSANCMNVVYKRGAGGYGVLNPVLE